MHSASHRNRKTPARIMLVEDNPEYREVIELTLADAEDLELEASFSTVEAAFQALEESQRQPDLLLLDIQLPGINGVEAIPQILQLSPGLPIIMLTQSRNEAHVIRAIQAGAGGYLLKSASIDEITEGIRCVLSGGASLDPTVAQFLVKVLQGPQRKKEDMPLSPRELEILELLSEGLLKKQIADRLGIGKYTVADHIKQIYKKLEVYNAPGAVTKAFRTGILPVPPPERD